MIRITSNKPGFRRAGISHPKGTTDYPDTAFTDAQLSAMKAEPMLKVELIQDAPPPVAQDPEKPAKKGKAKGKE